MSMCFSIKMSTFSFQIVKKFRDDEMHHYDIGLEYDAEKVRAFFKVLKLIDWNMDIFF